MSKKFRFFIPYADNPFYTDLWRKQSANFKPQPSKISHQIEPKSKNNRGLALFYSYLFIFTLFVEPFLLENKTSNQKNHKKNQRNVLSQKLDPRFTEICSHYKQAVFNKIPDMRAGAFLGYAVPESCELFQWKCFYDIWALFNTRFKKNDDLEYGRFQIYLKINSMEKNTKTFLGKYFSDQNNEAEMFKEFSRQVILHYALLKSQNLLLKVAGGNCGEQTANAAIDILKKLIQSKKNLDDITLSLTALIYDEASFIDSIQWVNHNILMLGSFLNDTVISFNAIEVKKFLQNLIEKSVTQDKPVYICDPWNNFYGLLQEANKLYIGGYPWTTFVSQILKPQKLCINTNWPQDVINFYRPYLSEIIQKLGLISNSTNEAGNNLPICKK